MRFLLLWALVLGGGAGGGTRAHAKRLDGCAALLQAQDLMAASDKHPLFAAWTGAQNEAAAVQRAVAQMPADEQKYFKPVGAAVVAALGKHQLEFMKERNLRRLDVPRHLAILRAIAEFDPTRARFALYKIKRAIEGRHALQEYIDCK